MSLLSHLVHDDLRFHAHGEQDWGTGREVLEFLDGVLKPSLHTVETGAGKSTILFAAKGCHHIAITPCPEEVGRIEAFCRASGIQLDRVRFEVQPSEHALPHLRGAFDLALIDGSHAFPWPFLDFFYLSRALRQYGTLIVDDIGIWSCGRLAQFLLASPEWQLMQRLPERRAWALVFRKLATSFTDEWERQPFVPPASVRQRAGRIIRRIRKVLAPEN